MVESLKERNVYEHNVVVKIMDYKISAIDVHGKPFSFPIRNFLNLVIFRLCDGHRVWKGLYISLWYHDWP